MLADHGFDALLREMLLDDLAFALGVAAETVQPREEHQGGGLLESSPGMGL
jgi:hypothetical protein